MGNPDNTTLKTHKKKALLDEIMSVCSFESTDNLKTILSVVKAMAKK